MRLSKQFAIRPAMLRLRSEQSAQVDLDRHSARHLGHLAAHLADQGSVAFRAE